MYILQYASLILNKFFLFIVLFKYIKLLVITKEKATLLQIIYLRIIKNIS